MEAKSTSDLSLLALSDAAWTGFLDYGESNGALDGSDAWGKPSKFKEFNPTPLSASSVGASSDIVIEQPCNTVSNIAYYYTMISMCFQTDWTFSETDVSALVRTFLLLASGSSFYHASNTYLGQKLDAQPIQIIGFIAFQATVESLPYNPVIHELSNNSSSTTGIQALDKLSQVIWNESVYKWLQTVKNLNIPSYDLTFTAMVNTLLNLIAPPKLAGQLTKFLTSLVKHNATNTFIEQTFQPALLEALAAKNTKISFPNRLSLLLSAIGVVTKTVRHPPV
jgi:hypothetical protein